MMARKLMINFVGDSYLQTFSIVSVFVVLELLTLD